MGETVRASRLALKSVKFVDGAKSFEL